MYRWTVDVEGDWGGRRLDHSALVDCLPIILREFKKRSIKALFFISTELLEIDPYYSALNDSDINEIISQGHEIGSHGHEHIKFSDIGRFNKDKRTSEKILTPYKSLSQESFRFRAPKFNRDVRGEVYSYRKSHVSLLKYMWFKEKIKKETVIYLHPFDLYKWNELDRPPNLFCRLWYSRPKKAYETFLNLLNRYPESYTK